MAIVVRHVLKHVQMQRRILLGRRPDIVASNSRPAAADRTAPAVACTSADTHHPAMTVGGNSSLSTVQPYASSSAGRMHEHSRYSAVLDSPSVTTVSATSGRSATVDRAGHSIGAKCTGKKRLTVAGISIMIDPPLTKDGAAPCLVSIVLTYGRTTGDAAADPEHLKRGSKTVWDAVGQRLLVTCAKL